MRSAPLRASLPDARWIAAASNGGISLIDARNPSHGRKLGASGVDGRLIWWIDSAVIR